jgi:hypothetical protein
MTDDEKIGYPFGASERIREFVRQLPFDLGAFTLDRAVIVALQKAWADAIRAEWYATIEKSDNEVLKKSFVVAKEMMREDEFTTERINEIDPIVLRPGMKPMMASDSISLEHTMSPGSALPLSAVYVERVIGIVEKLEKNQEKQDGVDGARSENMS